MKRNVIILTCLLGISVLAFGQKKSKKTQVVAPSSASLTIPGSAFLRPWEKPSDVIIDYKQPFAPLPKFNIINYQNKNVNEEVLHNGGNLILMMFNPTCDHCEDETNLILKNIFLFQKSKILLVAASVQTANLPYFESLVQFSQYPSTMTVAVDSANIIDKLFTYKALPQINIYDGVQHRLIKTFEGFVPLDSLKPYIQ